MTGSRSEHHLQNDNFILFVMSLSFFCMVTLGNWGKSLHWSMHTACWFYYIRLQFCFVLCSLFSAGGGWILRVRTNYSVWTFPTTLACCWCKMPVCVVTVTAFPPLSTTKHDALVQIKRNTEKYHHTRRTLTVWGFGRQICESMFFHNMHIRLQIAKVNKKREKNSKENCIIYSLFCHAFYTL